MPRNDPYKQWYTRKVTPFALRLRRARKNTTVAGKPMTQKQLAKYIGVSEPSIWRWEQGYRIPAEHLMHRLCQLLNLHNKDDPTDIDNMWLDVYLLPPDMQRFLATTVEGQIAVHNIRRIMNQMLAKQPFTQRKEIPPDAGLNPTTLRQYHNPGNYQRNRLFKHVPPQPELGDEPDESP